jgi:hypothetical protein
MGWHAFWLSEDRIRYYQGEENREEVESMVFLLDLKQEDIGHHELLDQIKRVIEEEELEIFSSVDGLHDRLCRALGSPAIVIFRPAGSRDLDEFLIITDLPGNIQIVLILPDHSEKTILQGHTIRPRYVSYDDEMKFVDVATVVQKINRTP